jgi:[NiFe] hydrogenase diaphorase moiety large subunit
MNYDTYISKLTFDGIESASGLKASLDKKRSEIIDEISASGLKGRGGAGFPTGIKWNLTASASSYEKFVVCNADEGEPGTFKDRVLMTKYPDLLFEGMTIAAYAIGAKKGYLYLRAEYTYLKDFLEDVLKKRRAENLLGEKIQGKEIDFDIEIRMGSGAYICGEETALIESMEGFRGEPRNRPPFPVDTGFCNHPTSVNNVETFLWAVSIMSKGVEWFRGIGTEKSPGLKIFSVSGDCDTPGIYEFPMGVTVAELLDAVGGQNAKAVQIGGASGICVPANEFDRKIAYEDVATGGSIII